jgi:hypothetical protein
MNVHETLEILRELKRSGATHFKSQDFEVSLSSSQAHIVEPLPTQPSVAQSAQAESPPIEENKEATEKLKELIKTMSLPPEQLVDVIFPNGAGG